MRTAKEIMSDLFVYGRGQEGAIVKAINEARKEAIEECAEVAELDITACGICQVGHFVNKESILSLIKELN